MDNIEISVAHKEDWEPAMELAWRTFLKFEADEYGKEGTGHFLDFISDEKLFKMFLIGEYRLAVAKLNGQIIGLVSLRSGCHISLLFVDERFHRKGIGKALLQVAQEKFLKGPDVKLTVNAAPYAIEFYKKVGFVETDDLQHADGIIFRPMCCLSRIC